MNTPPDPTIVVKMLDGIKCPRPSAFDPLRKRLRFDESFYLSSDTSSYREEASLNPGNLSRDTENEVLKSELATLREQLKECQLNASTYQKEQDRLNIESGKIIETLKGKLEKMSKSNDTLSDLTSDLEKQLDAFKHEASIEKIELKNKIVRLEKQESDQADEVKELLQNFRDELSEKEKESIDKNLQLKEKNQRIEELEDSLKNKMQVCLDLEKEKLKYARAQQTVFELELKFSQEKEKELSPRLTNQEYEEYLAMKTKIQLLMEDNALYKEAWDKHLVLEEEVSVLKHDLSLKNKSSKEMQELKVKYSDMTKKLQEWETLLTDLFYKEQRKGKQCGVFTVKDHIINMQKHHVQLTESLKEAQTEKESLRQSNADVSTQLAAAKREIERSKEVLKCHESALKKSRNKSLLLSKEVDMLKSLLNSYENEVTLNFNALEKQRITQLESILQDYKQQVKNLEQERGVEVPRTGCNENLLKLEERVRVLELQNQKLEERKSALETQLECRAVEGDYDPMKWRVIHHENNPLERKRDERIQLAENLQKEVCALKIKIKKMQSGEGNSSMLSQSILSCAADVEELKKKLSASEQKQARIVDMYNQASKDLRENIYCLTGYRVDATFGGNVYRLKHMYAEAEQDELKFEIKNEKLSLLDTPFSTQRWVREAISTNLGKHHSIPCFLAAITNTLYSRQAMAEDDCEIIIDD